MIGESWMNEAMRCGPEQIWQNDIDERLGPERFVGEIASWILSGTGA
jgi:hypothetical protein